MQNVQHIDIPFDELGIFKESHEQKYQPILIQTLLLSTLATVHNSKKDYKASLYITMKSIWLTKKQKIKSIIPVKSIIAVVKSHKHPQLVLLTRQNLDNIHLTTSTQQRSSYIISTLTYIFTYALKEKLCYISVRHHVLDYFQRTAQDKGKNMDINIESYAKEYLSYRKPFRDVEDLYGCLKGKRKIVLERQLEILATDENQDHLVYLARIRPEHEQPKVQSLPGEPQKQDRYICHYIQKKQDHMQKIYEHQNLDFTTQLLYAKTTDFKIQLFFEYSTSLRGTKVHPLIFRQLWSLYDKVKAVSPETVFTTDLVQVVERTRAIGEKVRREVGTEAEEIGRWARGERVLVVREFRYGFLNQATEWDRFLYQRMEDEQDEPKQNGHVASQSPSAFHNKLYTLALILYELSTGRHLFSYIPAFINQEQVLEEQIQLIVEFKKMISKGGFEMFPKFMSLGVEDRLKDFMRRGVEGGFEGQGEVWGHEWVKGGVDRKSGIFQ